MIPTVEAVGTVAGVVTTALAALVAARAAWRRTIEQSTRSPQSLALVVGGATDVVEVLRAELARMATRIDELQSEVDRLTLLVDTLEQQRDEAQDDATRWKRRAITLGWVATDGDATGTDAHT